MGALTAVLLVVSLLLLAACAVLGSAYASMRDARRRAKRRARRLEDKLSDAQDGAASAAAQAAAALAACKRQAGGGGCVGLTVYGDDPRVRALAAKAQGVLQVLQRVGCRAGQPQMGALQAALQAQLRQLPRSLTCAQARGMAGLFAGAVVKDAGKQLAAAGARMTAQERAQLTQAVAAVWLAAVDGACDSANGKVDAAAVQAFVLAVQQALCPGSPVPSPVVGGGAAATTAAPAAAATGAPAVAPAGATTVLLHGNDWEVRVPGDHSVVTDPGWADQNCPGLCAPLGRTYGSGRGGQTASGQFTNTSCLCEAVTPGVLPKPTA